MHREGNGSKGPTGFGGNIPFLPAVAHHCCRATPNIVIIKHPTTVNIKKSFKVMSVARHYSARHYSILSHHELQIHQRSKAMDHPKHSKTFNNQISVPFWFSKFILKKNSTSINCRFSHYFSPPEAEIAEQNAKGLDLSAVMVLTPSSQRLGETWERFLDVGSMGGRLISVLKKRSWL